MQYVMYIRFVDDVMSAHSRPGKDDANRAYAESDSPGAARAKSDSTIDLFGRGLIGV